MSDNEGLSPYAIHGSLFGSTQARNAIRLRERFRNDAFPPSAEDAAAFMGRLYAIYHAARLERGYRQIKNIKQGPTRAYRGQRGKFRQVAPASVTSPQEMSNRQLMYYKLHYTNWSIPTQTKTNARAVASGVARLIAQMEQEISGGLVSEKKSHQVSEAASVYRSLSSEERFAALGQYYDLKRVAEKLTTRTSKFLAKQNKLRRSKSLHACLILSQFENDLKNRRKFSSIALKKIEKRFLVEQLPEFPTLSHIHTRTARIAIAMVSAVSVGGTSKKLVIDQKLARSTAEKYDLFLS